MIRLALIVASIALALGATVAPAATTLPPVTRTKLKNGLTVIVMPTKRLPLVDLRLVVRAGSVNDPDDREGLARLTAGLLTQGAGRRTAQQLAEDISFVGGSLDASAGTEQTVIACEVLKKDFPLGLELTRDVVVSPTFAAEEFERKKQEALGGLESDKNDPSTVASNMFAGFLYQGHPLGHAPGGVEASVKAIQRDDVLRFHRTTLVPNRAILAVVGDVDAKATIAAITKAFGGWASGPAAPAQEYGAPTPFSGRQVRIVNKPEVTQTQIRMACLGVARNHPDYFPMQVANTILGAGFTSRLVNSIRVEQGLTYSIGSRFSQYRGAGDFRITTFTRNATLRRCVDAVLAEVRKLVDDGPTDAELDKARNYLAGQYPLGLQAPDDLAAELVNVEFFGLDPKFIETYVDRVSAVPMADVRRVLKERFCPDALRILVVSNPDSAKVALGDLGTVDVKDIE